jgi:hypothetical protein
LIIHTKIKIKYIKLTLECQREQSLRGTREEKGRELKKNMRKGGKNKLFFFFFNRLGPRSRKKEKNLKAMSCNKKATKRRRKKKLTKQLGTWLRHCSVVIPSRL